MRAIKVSFILINLILSTYSFGQDINTELCESIIVWDFKSTNTNSKTDVLPDLIEALLSKFNCSVLERRDFSTLLKLKQNEDRLEEVFELSKPEINSLQIIKAKKVLIGEVGENSMDNSILLKLKIMDLRTSQIWSDETIISNIEWIEENLREQVLTEAVYNLLKNKNSIKGFVNTNRNLISPNKASLELISLINNSLDSVSPFSYGIGEKDLLNKIKLLVSNGADINILGKNGTTSLHLAIKLRFIRLLNFF